MSKKFWTFLLIVATVAMAFLLMVYLHTAGPLPGAENVIAADGTYTDTQRGYGGDVTATLTIEGGRIADVQILALDETPALGGKAAQQLSDAILARGAVKGVDVVTGATVTSEAVLRAAQNCLNQARAASGTE